MAIRRGFVVEASGHRTVFCCPHTFGSSGGGRVTSTATTPHFTMMQLPTPRPCAFLSPWRGALAGYRGDHILVTVYEVIRRLPGIPAVRERSRAMATLDAILCRESWLRYYSFDPAWSSAEALASMQNGSGDEYSIVFSPAGAYARAFDHESPMSPWRCDPPEAWPGLFDAVPEVFRRFVQEPSFCQEGIPAATACWALNPEVRLGDLAQDVTQIGYPIQGG
jgi:hypothetical protein